MANPLSTIIKSLQNIFGDVFKKNINSYIGIDIGSAFIKVVQLKKEKGQIFLETYGEIALGPFEDAPIGAITQLGVEKIQDVLKDVLLESNVSSKNIFSGIASSSSLIFILELPKINERELSDVIKNEVRKYIPISLSEVSLDWWVIPSFDINNDDSQKTKNKKEYVQILVVAIRNEVLAKNLTIFSGMKNYNFNGFEVETFSAIRSSFKHEISNTMLIDFGASSIRVVITERGVIKKFHNINRGSYYLTESIRKSLEIDFEKAEKLKKEYGLIGEGENKEVSEIMKSGVNYIFSEIQTVLYNFEKQKKKSINKIILIGGGSLLKGFKERLEKEFNIEVLIGDPFSKAQSPDFLENILKNAGSEFAIATGLALKNLQ